MKILGIGVDIIDNKRIKKLIKNNKFKNRIYSANELKLSSLSIYKTSFFRSAFSYNFEDRDRARSFAEIYNFFESESVLISDSVPALRLKT